MEDVRIPDLRTFLAVHRTGSISAASRQLRTTPSQVSKAIARLEQQAGVRLFTRSSKGIATTPAALELLPRILSAIDSVQSIRKAKQGAPIEVTIVAPSYLVAQGVPVIASCHPRLRLRGHEMSPAKIRAAFSDNVFDMALVPGQVGRLPTAWTSDPVGELRCGLLGSPQTAASLEPHPTTADRVRQIPFVMPPRSNDRLSPIDDACPLTRSERLVGHECDTVNAAMEIAAATGQLLFAPLLAARRTLQLGILAEIPVEGWSVREPLHLVCNDSVLDAVRRAAGKALRSLLR